MAPPPSKIKHAAESMDEDSDSGSEYSFTNEPLSSQIGSTILKQQYGVDAGYQLPLKVQDAVNRCLEDVSTAVHEDHPRWSLPSYSSESFRTSTIGSDSSSRNSTQYSDPWSTSSRKRNSRQAGNDDDDSSRGGGADDDSRRDENDAPSNDGQRKKMKVRKETETFPCPFRRRNPVLFNIRDHEHCARKPFNDASELK